jgi:hypothetical protein
MPYLIYIKKETGYWHLTKKKDLSRMSGVKGKQSIQHSGRSDEKAPSGQNNNRLVEENVDKKKNQGKNIVKQTTERKSELKRHLSCILHIVDKYISTFHHLLFMFLIIGIITWTRINKERLFGVYIITVSALYFFVLYRLSIIYMMGDGSFMYPSKRHLMPLVMPAIFCVGVGIYTSGAWIHKKFQSSSLIVGFKELLKSTWIVQLIVLMIVVSVLLPKTLKPLRFDKYGIKEAGQWVKEHSHKPSPVILSDSSRNAYYAGGKHVRMRSIKNVLTSAQIKKVDYMLITYREYRVIEKELQQLAKNKKIALAYKYPENDSLNKRSVLLYEILY